jgi:hypothetical protein
MMLKLKKIQKYLFLLVLAACKEFIPGKEE